MEVAALASLLAVGYALTKGGPKEQTTESFEDVPCESGLPPPLYPEDKTAPGQLTVPGKPRVPRPTADGSLDLYYNLPSGGSLPSSAYTQPDLYPRSILFASPAIVPQAPMTAVTSQVRMNVEGEEAPPVYNSGKTVISPLTGLPMAAEEFTHNNMVPFYRGSLKQNMTDSGNRSILDDHIGMGSTQIAKREQGPLFDPHREPTGNIYGMESVTSFMQDRMVAPTNRAGERPIEPVQVAPGLNSGYSSFGNGGFQQFETQEIARQRLSVDELRAASNPKVTYEGMMIAGKSLNTQRGDLGETRKYRPDTFFLNENGERNFVTAGENTKATERPTQVMKYQTREDTTAENVGPATASDFKATYTTPSFRAPHVRQHDGFGFRNADGSTYGVVDTDAKNNDFGRQGYDLPVNQRNVTSERGQALNLTAAGVPKALTVYDPNDVARTTVRESTGANDWIGIASSAGGAQKLTVYDPTDITRPTGRNTLAEPDKALNVTRAGVPGQATLSFPDGMRLTSKGEISAHSDYSGAAGPAVAKNEQVYDFAYNMRQNPVKEIVAAGRKPVAGNGSLSLFNGEDYMNVQYRKLDTDSLNDRANVSDRVIGPPLGAEAIGLQRPKNILQLDISRDRNIHDILDSLNENPYALPVHRIAAGVAGPAEMAMAGGGW